MTVANPVRRKPDTTVRSSPDDSSKPKPRWATAAGAGDQFCHWYVNRSRTLCGISHETLSRDMMHSQAPCPNGHPPCPLCVQAYRDGTY